MGGGVFKIGFLLRTLGQKAFLFGIVYSGGSLGGFGWSEEVAKHLASYGFATLAIAYFDWEGNYSLPNQFADIKLKPFIRAIEWLSKNPMVQSDQIGLLGYSKGAELALLLATKLESVRSKAVIALSPSSHVFAGFSMQEGLNTSSWNFQNRSVSYLPYPNESWRSHRFYEQHDQALKIAHPEIWAQARIPVEKITSPTLLVAGEKDTT